MLCAKCSEKNSHSTGSGVVRPGRSDDGPARPGESDASSRLKPLADLVHLGEEARLVDERLTIRMHHDPAVYDHRVHATAVGGGDGVVARAEERLPLRPLGVEEHAS